MLRLPFPVLAELPPLSRFGAWLTLLMPFAIAGGAASADACGILLGLAFLWRSLREREWGWLGEAWVRIALLLWAYLLLRSFFVADIAWSLWHSLPWLRHLLMTFAIACWTMRLPGMARALAITTGLAVAFLVLDGYWQWLTGHDIFGRSLFIMDNGKDTQRLTGPFGKPALGLTTAWLCLPVLGWVWSRIPEDQTLRRCLAYAAATLLVLTLVFLSGDRMAMLLAAGGVAALTFWLRVPGRWLAVAGGVLLLTLMLTLGRANPHVQRQLVSTLEYMQHPLVTHYGQIWQSAFGLWRDHPLFGIGPHQFPRLCPHRVTAGDPNWHCGPHPHQLYLEWLCAGGLVAMFLFLALAAAWARAIWRNRSAWLPDPAARGWLLAMGLRLWPLSTAATLFTTWGGLPFWFVCAAAVGIATRSPHADPAFPLEDPGR